MRSKRRTKQYKITASVHKHRGRTIHSVFIRSAAHLHRPHAPAVTGQHAPPHDVAAAVAIVIGVVITGVIRIAVIVIVIVVAVAQAEADCRHSTRKSPVPETIVEATVETVDGKGAAAKSRGRQSSRT